ncbi:MAG: transcription antitermination factor NusB, partial [Acidobacteriaceae bacterium]
MQNPAPKPAAPVTPARAAAFTILLRVATTSAHSDDLLHGPAVSALSQTDRNMTTTLVLGVLRQQLALDARI